MERKNLSTLPGFKTEKLEKVKKEKTKSSEVVMRKHMRRWGFLEMLGSDQNPGGTQVSPDESRREPMVHRKSRFGFMRRKEDVKPILLTDALARSHNKGGNSLDIPSVGRETK